MRRYSEPPIASAVGAFEVTANVMPTGTICGVLVVDTDLPGRGESGKKVTGGGVKPDLTLSTQHQIDTSSTSYQ